MLLYFFQDIKMWVQCKSWLSEQCPVYRCLDQGCLDTDALVINAAFLYVKINKNDYGYMRTGHMISVPKWPILIASSSMLLSELVLLYCTTTFGVGQCHQKICYTGSKKIYFPICDPKLFPSFNPHQTGVSESLIRWGGGQMAHQRKSTI